MQLEGRLDAEGRALLNKLVRAYEDWADIREPLIFKEGFCSGMSIAQECAEAVCPDALCMLSVGVL